MKINEKTLLTYANSRPVDKEGYLMKRGEGKILNLAIANLVIVKDSSQH